MKDTKVSHSDREIFIRTNLIIKHEAMSRTVHRLHSESLLLDLEKEKVVLVVLVMSRSLPKFKIENVRRNDFLISSNTILVFNHVNKLVVDDSSHRVLEGTTRRKLIHVE
jgi:hypothetical protein